MASRSAGPLIYKVFRCLHLPCTGMAGGKGRRAYCLFFLRRILWSDRTKESVKMFLAPEWLEEKVGEHTVCPSCGESCGVIGQKEPVKMFLAPEWPEEKVGEHTVCPACAGLVWKRSREGKFNPNIRGRDCREPYRLFLSMRSGFIKWRSA